MVGFRAGLPPPLLSSTLVDSPLPLNLRLDSSLGWPFPLFTKICHRDVPSGSISAPRSPQNEYKVVVITPRTSLDASPSGNQTSLHSIVQTTTAVATSNLPLHIVQPLPPNLNPSLLESTTCWRFLLPDRLSLSSLPLATKCPPNCSVCLLAPVACTAGPSDESSAIPRVGREGDQVPPNVRRRPLRSQA